MKESRYNKIKAKEKIKFDKKIIILVCIILIITSIDQIVKICIVNKLYNSSITILDGILNLTYVENTGGAYGIGSNSTLMFIIVNVIVLAILTKFIISKKDEINTYILISIGLIMSGGIGNLIDRIFRGHVIDYIDINPLIKYPIFNIADICVVIGCAIIIISVIINTVKTRGTK